MYSRWWQNDVFSVINVFRKTKQETPDFYCNAVVSGQFHHRCLVLTSIEAPIPLISPIFSVLSPEFLSLSLFNSASLRFVHVVCFLNERERERERFVCFAPQPVVDWGDYLFRFCFRFFSDRKHPKFTWQQQAAAAQVCLACVEICSGSDSEKVVVVVVVAAGAATTQT